jgi:sensor c-di-GMP phosphodiesterase-like protein
MKRSHIIIVAVVLASLGAALPMAAMLYVSWHLAVKSEQDRLALFAGRAIIRANRSLAEVRTVLRAMADSTLTPCSTAHIQQMRRLAIGSRSVEEIGYFSGGLLKCTTWGPTDSAIAQIPGDYTTSDGIDVTIRMEPLVTRAKSLMALHRGAYNVLIDPVRLVDIIADPSIRLAIATDKGALIGELNDPDRALLNSLLAQPRNGIDQRHLFAVAHGDGWMAIATEPRGDMLTSFRREQMLLLPIGAFTAAIIVALVVWLSRKRLSPLGELAIAVEKREFIVHYQPIVELKTGICVGAEALVRWQRPDGVLVRPDFFIPLAEESGLILPITDQVIDAIIRDLAAMLVADRTLHIAVNLCAGDITTGRVLSVIQNAVAPTGIRAEQIWLEATERGFVDIDAARATIAEARRLGHSVAIDDFGTGYSSLQYLQGLPLDALKIDKSFIDTIGLNAATSSVTAHIIDMAKEMNLFLVAEGVESAMQLDYLLAHDVDFGQGWLFSRPLPARDFVAFYRRSKERGRNPPPVAQRAA